MAPIMVYKSRPISRDGSHPSGLLCFDSSRYWVSSDRDDNKCIAPTKSDRRCTFDISESELNEIAELFAEIWRSRTGTDVDQALERLVLLRCCGDTHREKLEHRRDVLVEVAQRYRRVLVSSPEPRTPRRPIRRGYDSTGSWQTSPELRHRYLLRPRVRSLTDGSPPPVFPELHAQLFVPYEPDPNKTLNGVLVSDVPRLREYRRHGEVYAFTWPTAPGFVKIGYTSTSVTARMNDWRRCHDDSRLIHRVDVEFPHRIEELIHLQLKDKQHKIVICNTCSSTHYEWFQESVERVKTIMDAWKAISDRTPLYTVDGRVASRWQDDILPNINGDYRAGKLLRALEDSDEELARAAAAAAAAAAEELRREEEERTRRENEERVRRENEEIVRRKEAEAAALREAIDRAAPGKPNMGISRRDSAQSSTQPAVLSAPEDLDSVVDAFADFFRMLEITRVASIGQLAAAGILNAANVQAPDVALGPVLESAL